MKEYSNMYYEMNYPSHWVVDESALVDFTTTFWNEERTAYFKVRTTNVSIDMYPEEVPEKFIEEVLDKKALKYEVGELSGFNTYKHVLSARINKGGNERIASSLINEGLATRLDISGRDYNRLAKEILEEKEYKIDILGAEFRKNEHAYILGASFVDYLINQYGMDNFKELFMQNEVNEEEGFKRYYEKGGQALVDERINSLRKNEA